MGADYMDNPLWKYKNWRYGLSNADNTIYFSPEEENPLELLKWQPFDLQIIL
jgi:hypothetical protein